MLAGQLNWLGVSLLLAGLLASTVSAQAPIRTSESQTKAFAPGVRIDWDDRHVEVEAVVVLRKGALELIACSPQTREHESIFAVSARPLDVFHAMGLIGFEPGSAPNYDDKNERWVKPFGHALEIQVRYEKDGRNVIWPIERWLLRNDTNKTPNQLPWIFTGSARLEGGRLAADAEGTLICVVDFAAALIALGDSHSADDQLLWLRANTESIPPVGTKCTLIISERLTLPLYISVDSDGTLTLGTRVLSVEEVVSAIDSLQGTSLSNTKLDAKPIASHAKGPRGLKPAAQKKKTSTGLTQVEVTPVVILTPKNAAAAAAIPKIISKLSSAGVAESRIIIKPITSTPTQ